MTTSGDGCCDAGQASVQADEWGRGKYMRARDILPRYGGGQETAVRKRPWNGNEPLFADPTSSARVADVRKSCSSQKLGWKKLACCAEQVQQRSSAHQKRAVKAVTQVQSTYVKSISVWSQSKAVSPNRGASRDRGKSVRCRPKA
jgi:hypothetical protein